MTGNGDERVSEIDKELISKGKAAADDFDATSAFTVKPRAVLNKLIAIRLPVTMIQTLKKVAEQKGVLGYQQLIKTYIAAGLATEQKAESPAVQVNCVWTIASPATTGSMVREYWDPKIAEHLPIEESSQQVDIQGR